tara:strand:- start:2598 stop:4211 length:1614 start_codon:yes stop_codon:yes gene_type:complete
MREETGSDGRTYQLINNEWVPKGDAVAQAPADTSFFRNTLPADAEAAMAMGSSVLGSVAGGYSGIGTLLSGGGLQQAAKDVETTAQGYQYQPSDPSTLQQIGAALQPLSEVSNYARGGVDESLGLGVYDAGLAGLEMLGTMAGGAALRGGGAVQGLEGLMPDRLTRTDIGAPITRIANRLETEGATGASNMTNRLAEKISGEVNKARTPPPVSINPMNGAPDNRVLQGYLYPEEVNNIMQRVAPDMAQDLTPGQNMLLLAETTQQKLHARDVIRNENVRSSEYGPGASLRATYDTQRELPGLVVKEQLGIPANKAFTIEVLGDKMNELGNRFDDFANDIGTVSITDDLVAQMDNIAELAVGNGAEQVVKQVNDIKKRLEIGGNTITGQEWRQIRTQLADAADSAKGQGEYGWGNNIRAVQDVMIDAMEGSLSPIKLDDIRAVRKQWSLVENVLSRAGNINADRTLSAKNLYSSIFNNPSRRKSFMRSGESGDFKRQLETFVTLGDTIVSDSGTPLRLSAQAGNLAKSAVRAVAGTIP